MFFCKFSVFVFCFEIIVNTIFLSLESRLANIKHMPQSYKRVIMSWWNTIPYTCSLGSLIHVLGISHSQKDMFILCSFVI